MDLQIRIPNPLPPVRAKIEQIKANTKRRVQNKTDQWVTEFFRWALSKRSVQEVITRQFTNGTPMCRVLNDAIEDHIAGNHVEASDIHGLERFIEDAVEHIEIGADSVTGLDEFVSGMIEEAEIDPDNIEGLEDKIDERVKEMLNEHEVKGDDVIGLELAVRECISNDLREGDLKDEITKRVCETIVEKLS